VVFQEEVDAYGSPTRERYEIVEFPHKVEELQEEIEEMEEMDVEEANDPLMLQDSKSKTVDTSYSRYP
jgi:squalene cyclase